MPEEKSKGWSLTKTFLKVAGIGLSIAFGFYVMGALDFTMFHEMAEGVAFMERAGPVATNFLRWDMPLLGFSVADSFNWLSGFFPDPGTSEAAMKANDAVVNSINGSSGTPDASLDLNDW
jgi:hypothetical protein